MTDLNPDPSEVLRAVEGILAAGLATHEPLALVGLADQADQLRRELLTGWGETPLTDEEKLIGHAAALCFQWASWGAIAANQAGPLDAPESVRALANVESYANELREVRQRLGMIS